MNIFEIMAAISINTSAYKKGIEDAKKQAEEFREKGSGAFGKFSDMAKGALKTTAITAKAATAAAKDSVVGLTKSSLSAYGEYEQLTGGVQKLYGNMGMSLDEYAKSVGKSTDEVRDEWRKLENAQSAMMKNAQNAFKNAGMSANQYMQNVTGFSAALINSVGGDTEQAAELADQAMRDIADNANTFGTYSVQELSGVYQALARGNFQTLDNLNLGFGGTKEGMTQLIERAEELDSAFKAQRDENGKLTMSYNDMVNAIHIVQKDMNITETTRREALGTLQGSLNMTKAAWDNLLTGMANKDADVGQLLSNVIDGALAVADNVEPMIDRIATSLDSLIDTALPKILDKIPSMLERLLPKLISVILKLANKLVDAIPQVLPVVFQAIQMLIQSIGESLPEILSMLVTLIETNLPTLIDNLVELALQVIDMLTQPDVISGLINAALTLVLGLLDGILRAIPKIVEALPEIVKNVISGLLQSLPLIVEAGVKLFVALVQNTPAIIAGICAAIPQIIGAIFESLASFGLDLGKIFYNAWEGIQSIFDPGKIGEWFGQVWAGIQNAFSQVGEWFSSIFSKAWEDIKNVFAPVGQTFQNIGDSILNGLKSAINGIIWGINQVIKVPFDGLNSVLMGIKSVEIMGWKPFDWIGEIYVPQIPELARGGVLKRGQIALLEGQGDEAVIPLSQNTEWIDMVADRLNNQQEQQNPQYTFNISIANMRADSIEDIENLAEMLMNVMAEKTSRKGAAY